MALERDMGAYQGGLCIKVCFSNTTVLCGESQKTIVDVLAAGRVPGWKAI